MTVAQMFTKFLDGTLPFSNGKINMFLLNNLHLHSLVSNLLQLPIDSSINYICIYNNCPLKISKYEIQINPSHSRPYIAQIVDNKNNKWQKLVAINNFNPIFQKTSIKTTNISISNHQAWAFTMSSQPQKQDIQSLSSLSMSIDPLQLGVGVGMGLNGGNLFSGRKSSFDYVNLNMSNNIANGNCVTNGIGNGNLANLNNMNMLKDSDQLGKRDYRGSLDILASNVQGHRDGYGAGQNGEFGNSNNQAGNKGMFNSIGASGLGNSGRNQAPFREIIQLYNQQNKVKIQQLGLKPMQIGQVYSESQPQPQPEPHPSPQSNPYTYIPPFPLDPKIKLETIYSQSRCNYHSFFPYDLAQVLKQREIPLQYVRGLLMVRDQKEIKTTRRLKVERYLEKRRKKTWSRKICYNCRQKVAEQRLRIKGKFIKKRRAMEILGLTIPIQTGLLKQKLYAVLKDKDNVEIDELLRGRRSKEEAQEQDSQIQEEDEDDEGEDDEGEEAESKGDKGMEIEKEDKNYQYGLNFFKNKGLKNKNMQTQIQSDKILRNQQKKQQKLQQKKIIEMSSSKNNHQSDIDSNGIHGKDIIDDDSQKQFQSIENKNNVQKKIIKKFANKLKTQKLSKNFQIGLQKKQSSTNKKGKKN